MTLHPDAPHRVVLALGTGAGTDLAVRLACGLAARHGGRLAALFVEDVDLLRAAALPFTREVGAFSAIRRPFEPAGMTAAHAAASDDLAFCVRSEAARARVAASVDVVRGRPLESGLVRTGAGDLLVVAVTGWEAARFDLRSRGALRMLSATEGPPDPGDSPFVDPVAIAAALAMPVVESRRAPGGLARAVADEGPDLVALSRHVLGKLQEELVASLRMRGGLMLVAPDATGRVERAHSTHGDA